MNNSVKKPQGRSLKYLGVIALLLASFFAIPKKASAQIRDMDVDMAMIDGVEINSENIFNYRINNMTSQSQQVDVLGRVHYRRSGLWFTYRYSMTVQPGYTQISRSSIPTPVWAFSETGLKDLFQTYNKLPQGTYEYCVSVAVRKPGAESAINDPSACVYQTVEDLFLINLVTPENDAKIYEYNPMLGWVVNYPFASELTYKLRVAELKQGQNPQNAITRNNPMYKDDHLMTTGTVYPVTAKPLVKWQPYVWTVDAYYKGILLGGAEVWKFTIVDDSELVAISGNQSYYEFEKHQGDTRLSAVGELKLKYVCDLNSDTLHYELKSQNGDEVKINNRSQPVIAGDNRMIFEIYDKINLKHKGKYTLYIKSSKPETFTVPFIYINPLYNKK
ncbi:MAG: hypothetical protein WC716_14915 [Chitinophagaceae bacterium]|jgi:hypothetical protein